MNSTTPTHLDSGPSDSLLGCYLPSTALLLGCLGVSGRTEVPQPVEADRRQVTRHRATSDGKGPATSLPMTTGRSFVPPRSRQQPAAVTSVLSYFSPRSPLLSSLPDADSRAASSPVCRQSSWIRGAQVQDCGAAAHRPWMLKRERRAGTHAELQHLHFSH
ncbi:hypothetical protein EYF80_021767 [Liparis tanakae]|uniref:Uncharacterized protein n=1 Tax=Liparis tanakae TaxID=230148 RepID=A0A4Z2HRN3_9TELE|nr:hypothetical protein EYF80_021767 [Liparis tanakae]